jgi:hypothetical protein
MGMGLVLWDLAMMVLWGGSDIKEIGYLIDFGFES